MTGFSISVQAKALLQTTGWYEGRSVSIDDALRCLRANGVEPSLAGLRFLSEFGGLRLKIRDGGVTAANFDVVGEMGYLEEQGDIQMLEAIVGQRVCPVGFGGRLLFFITPNEEMIFLHDEWVSYVKTKNVFDGFELLLFPDFECQIIVLEDNQKPESYRDG